MSMRTDSVTKARSWDTLEELEESMQAMADGKMRDLSVYEMALLNEKWGLTFDYENGHSIIDPESLTTEEHARKMAEWTRLTQPGKNPFEIDESAVKKGNI